MLEQKVQSVINEQQQILNSQKANISTVKTETTTSLSTVPVMSVRQPSTDVQAGGATPQPPQPIPSPAPQASNTSAANSPLPSPGPAQLQPVAQLQPAAQHQPSPGPSGAGLLKTAEQTKHLEARQSLQQLLAGGQTKPIVIKDPKTGQQHVMVQNAEGHRFLLQKTPSQVGSQGQLVVQATKEGQRLVQVQSPGQQGRQVIIQTSSGPQQGPSGQQPHLPGIPNQVVSSQAAAGQQIIQSKIVQHNGRTYLVQVRAQKPIEPGKQIVIKTNQPTVGGPGLVQEVMDEVIRQEYHKQEQQKISELALQLQQQSQEYHKQEQQK